MAAATARSSVAGMVLKPSDGPKEIRTRSGMANPDILIAQRTRSRISVGLPDPSTKRPGRPSSMLALTVAGNASSPLTYAPVVVAVPVIECSYLVAFS